MADDGPPNGVPTVELPYSKGDETADFGSFVDNEEDQIDLEDIAEPWHKYDIQETSRVFYPICLGEVLYDRYLVEHKIGFGGFSTVWMAHDLQDKRDVALKVAASGWGDHELRMQDEIIQKVDDTSHLVTYLSTFLLPENGRHHRVLVLPLMGPCLNPILVGKLSMTTRMSAARQLLEALETLHKAGIVHRDLNERNCMWGMRPLDSLDRGAKYERLGRPLKEIIPYVELWKQGELVRPVDIPENLRTEDFYLGDFGSAMKLGDSVAQKCHPPVQLCSPDRLHGKHPSFACDMWSYMVIFAVLYLRFSPFHAFFRGGIITSMVKCLGPLPEQWKGLYTHPEGLDSWYDQREKPDPEHDLASKIAQFRPDADSAERALVHTIMCKVFTYHPEDRLTATELLHDASFRALMDRYGC